MPNLPPLMNPMDMRALCRVVEPMILFGSKIQLVKYNIKWAAPN